MTEFQQITRKISHLVMHGITNSSTLPRSDVSQFEWSQYHQQC